MIPAWIIAAAATTTFRLSLWSLAPLVVGAALIVLLSLLGKVPVRYNVRNLQIRWRTTFMTALANTKIHDAKVATLEPVFSVYSGGQMGSLTPRKTETLLRRLNALLQATVDARTGEIRVALGGPTPSQASEALDSLLSLTNQFAVTNLRSRAGARRQFADGHLCGHTGFIYGNFQRPNGSRGKRRTHSKSGRRTATVHVSF